MAFSNVWWLLRNGLPFATYFVPGLSLFLPLLHLMPDASASKIGIGEVLSTDSQQLINTAVGLFANTTTTNKTDLGWVTPVASLAVSAVGLFSSYEFIPSLATFISKKTAKALKQHPNEASYMTASELWPYMFGTLVVGTGLTLSHFHAIGLEAIRDFNKSIDEKGSGEKMYDTMLLGNSDLKKLYNHPADTSETTFLQSLVKKRYYSLTSVAGMPLRTGYTTFLGIVVWICRRLGLELKDGQGANIPINIAKIVVYTEILAYTAYMSSWAPGLMTWAWVLKDDVSNKYSDIINTTPPAKKKGTLSRLADFALGPVPPRRRH